VAVVGDLLNFNSQGGAFTLQLVTGFVMIAITVYLMGFQRLDLGKFGWAAVQVITCYSVVAVPISFLAACGAYCAATYTYHNYFQGDYGVNQTVVEAILYLAYIGNGVAALMICCFCGLCTYNKDK